MKRYRILSFDFDTRVCLLDPIPDHWEESVKEMHIQNRETVLRSLTNQYGTQQIEVKVQNFRELGAAPFSLVASTIDFWHKLETRSLLGATILR